MHVGITPEVATTGYVITVPSGRILTTTSVIRGLEYELQGNTIKVDLVVLPMTDFDHILGMDWLTVNGASIDFWQRTVSVKPFEGDLFIFLASQSSSASHIISFVCARKLLQRGCQGFIASVFAVSEQPIRSMAEIEVVRDFPDVFLDDAVGIPLAREVKFGIELIPDIVTVSKVPYQLAPTEMKELKEIDSGATGEGLHSS
ncbi:uncharacterized protein [Henckelia pumila]|uniref:uncharacterized protein n=1 Tax=Henckelia pumila TaxID=405737 RepID=UPI003C6DD19A